MSNFKMRPKPTKPKKKVTKQQTDGCYYEPLSYTIEKIKKLWERHTKAPLDLDQCRIDKEYGYYNDLDIVIKLSIPESDEEFQKRMNQYGRDVVEYEMWSNEHRLEINKHNKEQKEIQLKKNKEELLKQREEIEEKLKKLRGEK